jgi:uncharacterized membrane protein
MSNYITTTKVLAIFLILLSIISSVFLTLNGSSKRTTTSCEIVWGIIGTLIHCLLFYSAQKKSRIAFTIWIFIAGLELIVTIYILILLSIFMFENETFINEDKISNGQKIFDMILLVANIFTRIFTIAIATKAKKKIEEEEQGGIFIRLY